MLYDRLENIEQYTGLFENLDTAIAYIAEHDLDELPEGRTDIDGDKVYVKVTESDTAPSEDREFEMHEKYIDIFYLLEGEEEVAVCPVEELGEVVEARPEGDIWLHKGAGVRLPLGGGRFLALFPGDGHAPSIGPNGPAPARKCVAKVRV